ncbi:MAG: cupin domain-containing protein [Rhodospirillaceae bacterium]|nr:cupin domain-containing protein [Rhodospirillaceae bacterium]
MTDTDTPGPLAIRADSAPPNTRPSLYPQPFAERVGGRKRHPLGDLFGLTNFGVNLTTMRPGSQSALLHRHRRQDEFIYVLQGEPTLVTDRGEVALSPGMCAGFPAGGVAHQLVNRTDGDVVYLEIGDRTGGDDVAYPNDDLKAVIGPDGQWQMIHKDGRPY